MAGIDGLFKSNMVTGLAVGVGVAILAPVIAPVIASVGKPLAKSVIKSGILFYEKGRETVAELGEVFDDLVAEARVELEGGGTAATAGATVATVQAPLAPTPAPEPPEMQAPQGDVS